MLRLTLSDGDGNVLDSWVTVEDHLDVGIFEDLATSLGSSHPTARIIHEEIDSIA